MEFAHGLPAAVFGVFIGKLTDAVIIELRKIKNYIKELEELEITVNEVKKKLHEQDQWQFHYQHNCPLKKSVEKLTSLCYDAEDLVDEVAIDVAKSNSFRKLACNKIMTLSKPNEIVSLRKELSRIAMHLDTLKKAVQNSDSVRQDSQPLRWLNFPTTPNRLIGRDNDFNNICELLISCDFKGVSIVGTYGVGKTALAENILCDPRIAKEFPLRIRILISDGVFNFYSESSALNDYLQNYTENQQGGQKLLIMFDNLCLINDDERHHYLNAILSLGSIKDKIEQVKVLITTPNLRVPELTGTKAYELGPLQEEDCKELIKGSALEKNKDLCAVRLTSIIDDLQLEKYGGLPIVAKTIGSLLGERGEHQWGLLSKLDFWKDQEFQARVFQKLSFSRQKMKPHLKMCLVFFSLFPPDYEFNKDNLAHLWVAEGFLTVLDSSSSSPFQDTTTTCWDNLLERSILLCSSGLEFEYKVPTSIHHYAQQTASGTCLLLDKNEVGQPSESKTENTRHLSLLRTEPDSPIWSNKKFKKNKLRTILSLYKESQPAGEAVKLPCIPGKLNRFLGQATKIRVLALNGTDVVELPEKINKLIHLRHIDISNTRIEKLPENICALLNLQFLNLKNTKVVSFPEKFHALRNLIYLYWDGDDVEQPSKVGQLIYLQTLPFFICLGEKKGYGIEELKNLNDLQSPICIQGLENVMESDAEKAKLCEKTLLTEIELFWDNKKQTDSIALQVLSSLSPQKYLQKLKITGYSAGVLPAWISDRSFQLVELHLYKCHCTQLTAIGQLTALKSLIIEYMSNLTQLDNSFCRQSGDTDAAPSFISLQKLIFDNMPNFKQWIDLKQHDMSSLRELQFVNCPVLETLPNLPNSLNRLEMESCSQQMENYYGGGGAGHGRINTIPTVIINGNQIPPESDEMDLT